MTEVGHLEPFQGEQTTFSRSKRFFVGRFVKFDDAVEGLAGDKVGHPVEVLAGFGTDRRIEEKVEQVRV